MIGTHRIMENDLFNIASRIKEIDSGYFIVYSYKLKRFEVHNRNQRGNSFCTASPFETLDSRLLEHVRRTRVERRKKLMSEIENENKTRERERLLKESKKAEVNIEKTLRTIKF